MLHFRSSASSARCDFELTEGCLCLYSVWSMAENLYDDVTRFWAGNPVNMSGMISIDGSVYRLAPRKCM